VQVNNLKRVYTMMHGQKNIKSQKMLCRKFMTVIMSPQITHVSLSSLNELWKKNCKIQDQCAISSYTSLTVSVQNTTVNNLTTFCQFIFMALFYQYLDINIPLKYNLAFFFLIYFCHYYHSHMMNYKFVKLTAGLIC